MKTPNQTITVSILQALHIGRGHFQAGNLPLAETIFLQVLKMDSNQADALQFLGLIAHQQKKNELAVGFIQRAIRAAPSNPVYHCNLGVMLKDLGRLDEAVSCYSRSLEIKPDYAVALSNMGNALLDQGKLEEAVACYVKALEIRPDYAEAHSNMGNALKGQGKLDEAIACYNRALEIRPGYVEAHSNLGNAFKSQGKLDEAIACYNKALEIRPGYAEALSNLGNALQTQGKLDEAAAAFRKALEADPLLAMAHTNLAQALVKQKKLDEALMHYRKALAIDSGQIVANDELSKLLAYLVPHWHVPMMNDSLRNEAYFKALKSAIKPDSNVLEIGTGSGLLAMMAASLGAKQVTTCEAEPLIAATAQQIVADNHLDNTIKVISSKSNDISVGAELEKTADLLVTEIFSSELLGEHALPSIEDAKRRLLKPGARIIPASGSIMIALFGGNDIASNLAVGDCCGFDLRSFNSIIPRKQPVSRNDLNIELLSGDVEAFSFNFENDSHFPEAKKTLRIPVAAAGLCYGIIQWIRLQMDDEIVFENHPSVKSPASGWQYTTYMFPQPVSVSQNQVALISAAHNRICPWFSLDGIEEPSHPT